MLLKASVSLGSSHIKTGRRQKSWLRRPGPHFCPRDFYLRDGSHLLLLLKVPCAPCKAISTPFTMQCPPHQTGSLHISNDSCHMPLQLPWAPEPCLKDGTWIAVRSPRDVSLTATEGPLHLASTSKSPLKMPAGMSRVLAAHLEQHDEHEVRKDSAEDGPGLSGL